MSTDVAEEVVDDRRAVRRISHDKLLVLSDIIGSHPGVRAFVDANPGYSNRDALCKYVESLWEYSEIARSTLDTVCDHHRVLTKDAETAAAADALSGVRRIAKFLVDRVPGAELHLSDLL